MNSWDDEETRFNRLASGLKKLQPNQTLSETEARNTIEQLAYIYAKYSNISYEYSQKGMKDLIARLIPDSHKIKVVSKEMTDQQRYFIGFCMYYLGVEVFLSSDKINVRKLTQQEIDAAGSLRRDEIDREDFRFRVNSAKYPTLQDKIDFVGSADYLDDVNPNDPAYSNYIKGYEDTNDSYKKLRVSVFERTKKMYWDIADIENIIQDMTFNAYKNGNLSIGQYRKIQKRMKKNMNNEKEMQIHA